MNTCLDGLRLDIEALSKGDGDRTFLHSVLGTFAVNLTVLGRIRLRLMDEEETKDG